MKAKKVGKNIFLIKLERGEEIVESLKDFFKKQKIKGGWFFGIGAAKDLEVSYFDTKKKKYLTKKLKGDFEVLSLVGNLAWEGKSPLLHCHIVVSDKKFKCFGGHLKSGKVSVVIEITFLQFSKKLLRSFDNLTKLKLLVL